MSEKNSFATGGWLPADFRTQDSWLGELTASIDENEPLHSTLVELKELSENDLEVYILVNKMLSEVPARYKGNPVGGAHMASFDQLLRTVNAQMKRAPEYSRSSLIALPINAILDWPMGTPSGFAFFINAKVNAAFKRILNQWCEFLDSKDSLYVLNDGERGWMCEDARKVISIEQYVHDPNAPHWGFNSWNDFFTRELKDGQRPVADPENDKVIVSPCEATPYLISTNAQRYSKFWIKSETYALHFLLGGDDCVDYFIDGTVYQAYLSPYNYHRWHSPVSGTIKKAWVQQGAYFSEIPQEEGHPDGIFNSEKHNAQVAIRGIILIECNDPKVGLVAFLPIGMASVSSIKITVTSGQKVQKGDPLGYFQYGGSSMCLMFKKGVISEFHLGAIPHADSVAVPVNSRLAIAN